MDVGQSPCSLAVILLPVLLATQAVPPIHPTSGCLQQCILHMPPSTSYSKSKFGLSLGALALAVAVAPMAISKTQIF
ncbi:hypothetical protein L208DRAFT_1408342 [Tricholoma matsutake]|nr:hypothetical protein L208DRAFT_1408342 [Tricholoma matsutake 945]